MVPNVGKMASGSTLHFRLSFSGDRSGEESRSVPNMVEDLPYQIRSGTKSKSASNHVYIMICIYSRLEIELESVLVST